MTDEPNFDLTHEVAELSDHVRELTKMQAAHTRSILDLRAQRIELTGNDNIVEMRDLLATLTTKVDTLIRTRIRHTMSLEANAAAINTLQEKHEILCRRVKALTDDLTGDRFDTPEHVT